MPYEVEETGELSRTAKVTVTPEEYEKRVNKALREVGKDVNIRGFRKGNVPLGVLKKRYGASVQSDVVEQLVRGNINEVIKGEEQPVIHIGEPEVTSSPDSEEGLAFTVEFELQPEIDPVGYLGLDIDMPEIEVSDEEVDEKLEELRQQYATLEPIAFREEIQEGDIVTFDYEAIGDQEELEVLSGENAQIEVGQDHPIPEFNEGLLGAGFEDTVTVEVTADEDFPIEELRGETFELELNIKSVKTQVMPDLDDEFAKDTGEAETLLELRGNVREDIAHEKEHGQMHEAEDKLVEMLLEQNDISLPEKFVESQVAQETQRREQMLQQFTQQGLDIEEIGLDAEEFTSGARKEVEEQIRTEFLLLAIAEKEGLELEEDDLRSYIEHRAQHQGVAPQQMLQHLQQDREQWRQANVMALIEKTKRYLMENADVGEIDLTEDDEVETADASEASEVEEAEAAEEVEDADEADEADEQEE
ncbi:MAG: trigger factor [Myxococcota bacterium]